MHGFSLNLPEKQCLESLKHASFVLISPLNTPIACWNPEGVGTQLCWVGMETQRLVYMNLIRVTQDVK